ncbi:MAG: sigma-70 family RNA polymerase sigma factor [Ignavibacteriae bacterium]|nr:sigma-70 family RNA polymerase sigma factor [Ignavibacteriota bacterium]
MEYSGRSQLRLIQSPGFEIHTRFEELFLHHLDALYRTALRLTKKDADAEDLLQETLIKAWKHFHQLQDDSKMRSWLFRILMNTFYNFQSSKKRELPIADVELNEDLVSSSLSAVNYDPIEVFEKLMEDEVESALDKLHPEFKAVILLYDIEGLSYEEIAEVCQCSKGTVASRLYRAREILRIKLEKYAKKHGYL